MPERLILATPAIVPAVTTTEYRVVYLGLYLEPAMVVASVRSEHGDVKVVRVEDAEALAVLRQLNTADLSARSLQKRVLEWVSSKLAPLTGTVTGTPDGP